MPDPPTGTVTFLFTDIESSTRLWEEYPDAMGRALARHEELLREAIEAHGGYVFKTGGDSFCAAFAGAQAPRTRSPVTPERSVCPPCPTCSRRATRLRGWPK